MSNNRFSAPRFLLLFKQHFIHNTQFLLLSTGAYIGVIFIVLSIAQVGSDLQPHTLVSFQRFLVGFFAIFGILYVGHSFPAFRSKESAISYLMVPASALEKFLFEFVSRIGTILFMLPLLYWVAFHLQGYFFTIFTDKEFDPIGLGHLVKIEVPDAAYRSVIYTMISAGALLAFVLALTGAAIFHKQPLVKTLFSLAVIVFFYIGYSYIVVVHLGVKNYNPPLDMWLIPMGELAILRWISVALIVAIVVMLFVGYRKLKEKEV